MTTVVALVLGASFVQALGTALQKREVAAGFADLATRDFVLGFRRVIGALARRRLWLLGFAISTVASLGFLEAFGRADLSVVVPLAATGTLFTVALGVALLGERLRGGEWWAIGAVVAGATLVGTHAGITRQAALPTGVAAALTAGGMAASLLLVGTHALRPRLLSRELALGLAAAVQIGAGNLLVKAAVEAVRTQRGAFSAGDPGVLLALGLRPEIWIFLATQVAAFVLIQAAYARGRVAVIGPVLTAGNTSVSLAGAVLALGEVISPGRLAGITALVGGTVALAWLHPAPQPSPAAPPADGLPLA